MSLDIRPYDPAGDLSAIDRIWREVGWLDKDDDIDKLRVMLEASNVEVGLLDGQPECAVVWTPGSIRYQNTDLPFCGVMAVTTSRIGRKQGFATTMTGRALRAAADAGYAVAGLGIFDQGFYDRLGFGTGPYEYRINLDPASLAVGHIPYRRPVRLAADDHAEMHRAMVGRNRPHGSVVFDPPAVIEAECGWTSDGFGLGYRNEDGRLTHFLWGSAKDEHGPYRIGLLAYENTDQLLELLRVIRELGDQVTTVRMPQPAEVQLQDLIDTPFRRNVQTASSTHATGTDALACYQYRILDPVACVAARTWPGPEVRFNLVLSDPAVAVLDRDGDNNWPGVAGSWVVTLGSPSSIRPGSDPSLDTVEASVNGFTRAWLGACRPSTVAVTGELAAEPSLLSALDEALALPTPHPGWEF